VLSVAFISPAGSKGCLSIAEGATVSLAHAVLDDDAGLDGTRGDVRVMPAPLSKRLPAPATLHEVAVLSARSVVAVRDEVVQSDREYLAARHVRIRRHIPRMAPEEPPWLARVS
jgi:hypothetical protein